ncbi:MAG: glucose dehydrogenase [Actinobacteria bacterium]|nr:MAG: glucose dehydrogenase [Actinomycetota bacterium]
MRRTSLILIVLLVAAACSGQAEETTTTAPSTTTTTSTAADTTTTGPSTTTTTEPGTTTTLAPLQSLAYEPIASFAFPVQVLPGPAQGLVYVVDKVGYLWALTNGDLVEEPVLDISGLVSGANEQGFLSAALHPDDGTRLFIHYTDTGGDTMVAEYSLPDPLEADPGSERALLQVDQPARNHNGGLLLFAPDGRLILGLGDGGGAGDQFGNGQNTDTLLGGLVAIDPETGEASLYAHGLRNPWRFWLDDGFMYIADVGQNSYEEINATEFDPGLNFGWPIMEGLHCFSPPSGCDQSYLVPPVVEIAHGDAGTCSITGGVVYRGSEIPELNGHYLFSDYCGGYLRSFDTRDAEFEVMDWTDDVGVPGRVTGFGVDADGEVYVVTDQDVLRLVAVR